MIYAYRPGPSWGRPGPSWGVSSASGPRSSLSLRQGAQVNHQITTINANKISSE